MANDLGTLLHQRVSSAPTKIIYSFFAPDAEPQSLTYQQLYQSAQRIAEALKITTSSTDIITLSLRPSLRLIELIFGCILANRTFMPIYPLRSQRDVARAKALLQKLPRSLVITDYPLKEEKKSLLRFPHTCLDEIEKEETLSHLDVSKSIKGINPFTLPLIVSSPMKPISVPVTQVLWMTKETFL